MEDSGPFQLRDDEFVQVFGRSQSALHSFIMGIVYNRGDADDLLQEVNLALWKKRHTYDSRSNFLRWAIGFAKNEASNFRKKYARSPLMFSDAVLDALTVDWPGDLAVYDQRIEALTQCLKKLDRKEQHFITEFYQRQVGIRELAELTDTPASSIYKILNRARESLRRCVQLTLAQSEHPA